MRRAVDSMSKGFLFIALGIVFFLNTYGILSWGFWVNVMDLWPLILILGGIALLFNKRIPFSTVLLVFLIVLVGYSMLPWSNPMNPGPYHKSSSGSMDLIVPLEDGIKKANVTLNLGGANFNLNTAGPISDSNNLLAGHYNWAANLNSSFNDAAPKLSRERNGEALNIEFNAEKRIGNGEDNLDFTLSPRVDYEKMEVNAGAFKGTMDLSQLRVSNLDINSGASQLELRFGDTGMKTLADINSGASKVTLVVPEQAGLKIAVSGFTNSTNFAGDGLFLQDKEWVSPNYDSAKTKIDISMSVAAGKIDLVRSKTSGGSSDKTY